MLQRLRAEIQARSGEGMDGDGRGTDGELCETLQVLSRGLEGLQSATTDRKTCRLKVVAGISRSLEQEE